MRAFLVGLQFLSIIRLTRIEQPTQQDFGRSVRFFPLVGLLIGGALAVIWLLLHPFVPAFVLAVLLVLTKAILTGGLHLDGLMDTADGVLSWRSRERMLEIMKDSRVGASGVMVALFAIVLGVALLTDMPTGKVPYALLLAPAIARWVMVVAVCHFPYVRPTGFGHAFATFSSKMDFIIATIITMAAIGAIWWWKGLALMIINGLFGFVVCRWLSTTLGGLTGDTYGAVAELSELVIWLVILWM